MISLLEKKILTQLSFCNFIHALVTVFILFSEP